LAVIDVRVVFVPIATPVAPDAGLLAVTVGTDGEANVAVTDLALVIAILHAPVPEQDPAQPRKVDPAAGAAVRETEAPLRKLPEHVGPQLIPAGELVTVPLPLPVLLTLSRYLVPDAKVTLTLAVVPFSAVGVTVKTPSGSVNESPIRSGASNQSLYTLVAEPGVKSSANGPVSAPIVADALIWMLLVAAGNPERKAS
jgi:hypothetical protein